MPKIIPKSSTKDNKKNKEDIYSKEAQQKARTVPEWYDRVVSGVEKCPFCDLRAKYIVAEIDGVVLTMSLFPYIDGHMLLVTRRHIERYTDLSLKEWKACKKLIEVGMGLLASELGYENVNVLYREGTGTSGSSLKHWHMHILPITGEFMQYEQTNFRWVFQEINLSPGEMAERLRNHGKEKK